MTTPAEKIRRTLQTSSSAARAFHDLPPDVTPEILEDIDATHERLRALPAEEREATWNKLGDILGDELRGDLENMAMKFVMEMGLTYDEAKIQVLTMMSLAGPSETMKFAQELNEIDDEPLGDSPLLPPAPNRFAPNRWQTLQLAPKKKAKKRK